MRHMAEAERWKPYTQRQGQLLPAFVEDGLDRRDPVFFIDEAVEQMDLRPLEARYAVLGERAYAPRLLLKLWLYGATQGVYSGRELARRCRRDLGFRYLVGDSAVPDFRTINRFRLRHREDFAWILRETLRLARAAGLVKLGVVTVDGTKVRANTSRSKAMSHGRMQAEEARLEQEIAQLLQRLDDVQAAEDAEHGEDDDGSGGLPRDLADRERRLARLRAAKAQLEQEKGAAVEPRHQKSFADPEANMMKVGTDGALTYGYNAQVAASADGFIVATKVVTTAVDCGQLLPMLDAVDTMMGQPPTALLADNGYLTEAVLGALTARGQRALVAVGRERKRAGRWPRGPHTQRMHRLLRLPWARALYARRKTQGERPFAEIKHAMGFRRCMLRGYAKVCGEWDLVSAACNLRRLRALVAAPA
jgi:transposase